MSYDPRVNVVKGFVENYGVNRYVCPVCVAKGHLTKERRASCYRCQGNNHSVLWWQLKAISIASEKEWKDEKGTIDDLLVIVEFLKEANARRVKPTLKEKF